MEHHISEILSKSQLPKLSPKEVLENYDHIELTEDEELEGRIWAKQRKEAYIKNQEALRVIEENRKKFTGRYWSEEQTKAAMKFRAEKLFEGKFIVDESNVYVFNLLCAYFSQSNDFYSMASFLGMENASLSKGILLQGNFGSGKTWLMKLFAKNSFQCFNVINAKVIADKYQMSGNKEGNGINDGSADYIMNTPNPVNDASCFYQAVTGLCIDDMGTEDIKNYYGNRKNVIGDLIEMRYAKGTTGITLHATSNMTSEDMKKFYGNRITSRMREIFNQIELKGNDRRK